MEDSKIIGLDYINHSSKDSINRDYCRTVVIFRPKLRYRIISKIINILWILIPIRRLRQWLLKQE